MEADDEIKNVKGTSYDFGARMYDPRVGRWLSIDPLEGKQPDQSPYKAMRNNPIFWIDPDGKTEYQTIIIKDETTGQSAKFYVAVSEKIMTDGIVECTNVLGLSIPSQYAYDYRHVTTFTMTTDGQLIIDQRTEVLKDNGVKGFALTDEYVEGQTWDLSKKDDPFLQRGGAYMTGSNGQGTKYHSKNVDYIGNMDMLISILSNYSASAKFSLTNKDFDNSSGLYSMLETLMEQMQHNLGKIDKIGEVVDEIKKLVDSKSTSTSDEMSEDDNSMSNTTVWKQLPDGHFQGTTSTSSPEERTSGDTLNGSQPHKTLTVTPSGDTLKGSPSQNGLKK